jgi:hypothetical protein
MIVVRNAAIKSSAASPYALGADNDQDSMNFTFYRSRYAVTNTPARMGWLLA